MKSIKPIAINKFTPCQCVNLNKIDRNKLNAPTIIKITEIVFMKT